MKITGTGRTETTPVKRKKVSTPESGTEFVIDERTEGGVTQTHTPASIGTVSSISTLIGLQEVDDKALQGRRKAFNRAREMLDLLEELRYGLLSGSISSVKINRLLSISKSGNDDFVDPGLVQILSDIETRAKVELAKIEMSLKGS